MAEEALLLVRKKICIEVVKPKSRWQFRKLDLGNVNGRGAERAWIDIGMRPRSVVIIVRAGLPYCSVVTITVPNGTISIMVHASGCAGAAIVWNIGATRVDFIANRLRRSRWVCNGMV